ncbi:endothelial cell-specific chemotaxis regulator isoform X2 [Alligator sinensis]|uniref:Endothelial cell-specific chemotaxis regulator isoform X2 n=1 Tax=Alligator sinensis TaxID=38654 RepID=A0A1U8D4Z5_ALLSI|nr:endothelial cell-specific chemotaxis regulator isoform X2 [Alligator sinensis]
MPAPNFCVLFWISGCVLFQDVNTAQPSATQPPAASSRGSTAAATTQASTALSPPVNKSPLTTASATLVEQLKTTLTSAAASPKATGSGNTTSSPTSGADQELIIYKQKIIATEVLHVHGPVISEAHKEAISAENTMISPSAITPTEKSGLEIVAFGVIGFIGILVVVVFILVGVVYLRFRCNHSKDAEDKQKPEDPVVSESCSAATNRKNSSVTLISMKNINMNNSLSYPTSEKVL